jgi:hypothetical protein
LCGSALIVSKASAVIEIVITPAYDKCVFEKHRRDRIARAISAASACPQLDVLARVENGVGP